MLRIIGGAVVGFLAGGVIGGATFGPLGSLVGSIFGIPAGAAILWLAAIGREDDTKHGQRAG